MNTHAHNLPPLPFEMLRVHNHNDPCCQCVLRDCLIRGDVDAKLINVCAQK